MNDRRPPETIGPYRILRRLGHGGMAEVYIAEDEVTGEEHALKLMIQGTAHADRFNQEYEALTRLNHPGIVRVYQYGIHETAPWFSMEHIAGEPLQVWISRFGRPGSPARNAEIMRACAFLFNAVGYVHDRGLIHRDLKGGNVLILPDGRVKLLDFGTAHIRDSIRNLTRPGEFVGTLAYASPEQFRGDEVDHRADIYAVGVLMYRMVTGARPFDAEDPATLARMIVKGNPTPPQDLIEGLPPGLNDLILRLLARKPKGRPDSASQVADELERLIGEPLGLPGWGASIRRDRLAGREPVLRKLRHFLRAAKKPLLLLGQPGSDRSQVAQSLLSDAMAEGLQGIQGSFEHDQTIQPVLTALLKAAERLEGIDDPRVVQAISAVRILHRRGPEIALRNRSGLHAAASSVLVGILRVGGPTMLALVDVHRADVAALQLLRHLHAVASKGKVRSRWLFVGELQGGSTLQKMVHHLPPSQRVTLPPLDITEVALRVGAMLDRRPPPTSLARTLYEASGGQPHWVEELVYKLVEDGAIRIVGSDGNRLEWELHGELQVPRSATTRLHEILLGLPQIHQRILFAVAAAGPPCNLNMIEAALGWSTAELIVPLKQLARDGWIRVDQSVVHLTQPLFERILNDDLHPARRYVLNLAMRDAVLTAPARRTHVRLLLDLNRPNQAIDKAIEGANHRLDDLDAVEALEFLAPIASLSSETEGLDLDRLARALVLYAKCLLMVRPIDPALARTLLALKKMSEDPAVRFQQIFIRARLQRTLGHLVNHQRQLEDAAKVANELGDPRLKSMVLCFQADSLRIQGQIRDASRCAQQGLTIAEEAGELPKAWAKARQASVMLSQGMFLGAKALAEEALETFERHEDRRGTWAALPTLTAVLKLRCRYSDALRLLYKHLTIARRHQEPSHTVRLLLATAEVEADLYRLGRAQEHLDEIETLIRKGEQLDLRLNATVVRGRLLIASGLVQPARMLLEDAHARSRAAGLTPTSELARALSAECLAHLGEIRPARDLYASAILGLLGSGDTAALVEGTLSRLRALATHDSPEMLTKPVQGHLNREELEVLVIEHRLAEARYARTFRRTVEARAYANQTRDLIDAVSDNLDETDQAALRLHPWYRQIRTILQ
ncbi:MAG: hypothetical protein EA397_15650 [Deltaproteobacteria bacterium]|nr:MAG: hypothetical protein EA397_15650 [Deltaproteobacteria bacterium]